MSRFVTSVLVAALVPACSYTPSANPSGDDDPGADAQVVTPGDGATATCGTRPGQRGYTNRSATVAGLDRTYHVYLPPNASPTDPMPLVIVLHGFTMSGNEMHDVTRYQELADAEGIAVAFPDGEGGPNNAFAAPWNVGTDICPSTIGAPPTADGDDFAFLDYIKADVAKDQCIDSDHVFATGFSMGGYFSHHIGCMRTDFAGVAPHSGGTHPLDSCATSKMPIMIFHGKVDPLVPAGCDDPNSNPVNGVTPAADAWAMKNGCSLTTTTREVTGGTCYHYEGCPTGGQVELCTFDNAGHCWAGGKSGIYACPNTASATQLEWDFWKQYAW